MKEFLEKFGLTEILSYLFPGFLALCAIVVWGVPDPTSILGPDLGKNEFLLGVFLLIFAYAVGLILQMWGLAGSQAATQTVPWTGGTWTQRLRYAGLWLRWKYVHAAAGTPPLMPEAMLGMLEIHDLLQDVYSPVSMPLLLYPATQLAIFRAALCERIKDRVGGMMSEPEVERRRYVFSMGVALAMMVLAASALARLAVAMVARIPAMGLGRSAPWRTALTFVSLAALGVVAAVAARQIWFARKWTAYLLWASALFCVGAPAAVSLLRPSRLAAAFSAFDPSLPGVALLAAVSVTVCFFAQRDLRAARTLLLLFVTSIVCISASVLANAPLLWLGNVTRWDAAHSHGAWFLLLVALAAYFASRKLRKVAVQCQERELAHTLAIVRLFGHYF